jgi:hypothetical protein
VASSHESELPDKGKRPRKIQNLEKTWVLRGEITTNPSLLLDETSMDYDGDEDAKVQNTKSHIEAALGAKFESLLGKMLIKSNISRCEGSLVGNNEYEGCRRDSPWLPVQITGDFGNNNEGRAKNMKEAPAYRGNLNIDVNERNQDSLPHAMTARQYLPRKSRRNRSVVKENSKQAWEDARITWNVRMVLQLGLLLLYYEGQPVAE